MPSLRKSRTRSRRARLLRLRRARTPLSRCALQERLSCRTRSPGVERGTGAVGPFHHIVEMTRDHPAGSGLLECGNHVRADVECPWAAWMEDATAGRVERRVRLPRDLDEGRLAVERRQTCDQQLGVWMQGFVEELLRWSRLGQLAAVH